MITPYDAAFIADIIEYRLQHERMVKPVMEATITPAAAGVKSSFRAVHYEARGVVDFQYLALILGEPAPDRPCLVRVQTACIPGDVFGSPACDCGLQVSESLRMIEEGADLLDLGAESSRPGSQPVGAEEEKRRLLPVLTELRRQTEIPLTVDTFRAPTARHALGSQLLWTRAGGWPGRPHRSRPTGTDGSEPSGG